MQLADVKEVDGSPPFRYAVKFRSGAKNARFFNRFTEFIGGLDETKFSVSDKAWLVTADGYEDLEKLDLELYPPKKTMKEKLAGMISIETKDVTDWENMGVGMKLSPYEYQKKVIKFITDSHDNDGSHDTLIVSPCGSGKTPMLLGAYIQCHNQGIIDGPGMIVVKASLKLQWFRETMKFTGLTPRIIKTYSDCVGREENMINFREQKAKNAEGEELAALKEEIKELKDIAKRKFKEQFDGADLYILNYETLNDENVRKAMLKLAPQFVGADEIQYIKGAGNVRSKSLCKFNGAKVKIGATATPVQRDPRDIYGIFKLIHPELFKTSKDFNALYVKYGYGYRVIGAKNEKKLNEKISPYMYILTKEEVSKHLPKLVVSQRYCDLSEKQQAANDTLMEELEELSEKEKAITKGMSEKEIKSSEEVMKLEAAIAARQTFLQELTLSEKLLEQSSSDIAKKLVTGDKSSKLQVLKDMVSEIVDSGEKVCIFSRFAKMQPIIAEAIHSVPELKNIGIAYVRGELSSERRDEEVYTKFRDNDDYKVLVCSDAGAEGLNLSLCKYLIELEPAVSYAIQTQRHGRLERADSVHDTVFVTQLIASNSWDEIMMKSIEKKEKFDMSIIKGVDLEIIG